MEIANCSAPIMKNSAKSSIFKFTNGISMKPAHCIFFLIFLFGANAAHGQAGKVKDESEFTAVIKSETGDTCLTIIYGNISELRCLFNISDVHIGYGTKNYYFNIKQSTLCRSDDQGNYVIEIHSFQQNQGLSFHYWKEGAWADFFVPVPEEWKGKRVKVDIGMRLLFWGIECF